MKSVKCFAFRASKNSYDSEAEVYEAYANESEASSHGKEKSLTPEDQVMRKLDYKIKQFKVMLYHRHKGNRQCSKLMWHRRQYSIILRKVQFNIARIYASGGQALFHECQDQFINLRSLTRRLEFLFKKMEASLRLCLQIQRAKKSLIPRIYPLLSEYELNVFPENGQNIPTTLYPDLSQLAI